MVATLDMLHILSETLTSALLKFLPPTHTNLA